MNHIAMFKGIKPHEAEAHIHISHNAWLNVLNNQAYLFLLPVDHTMYIDNTDMIQGK